MSGRPISGTDLTDRRRLAFDGTTAHASLRGQVPATRFVPGHKASVRVTEAPLLRGMEGGMDKALLWGEPVTVISETGAMAFVQSEWDGYVGYADRATLGRASVPNHRVVKRASHLYPEPDFKAPVRCGLSIGSALEGTISEGRFLATSDGFVPLEHVMPCGVAQSMTETALHLLGAPYLWGGNSATGIDCSGLVQLVCRLAEIPCPRDSDQQAAELGAALPEGVALRAGDFVFWRGHVGMMLDATRLIHANAHHMAVAIEPLASARARIGAHEFGAVTSIRRV